MAGAALAVATLLPQVALAEPVRIATYNVELSRRGPGLLYAAILKTDPQVLAVQQVIVAADPDILLITGFDYDADLVALSAFRDGIASLGLHLPYLFALRPNTGKPSGVDLDGDGALGGPGDAQGWGRFSGTDGMALLSRYPLDPGQARDFSAMLWRDLPGAAMPQGMADDVRAVQRLSTTGHWDVPVETPGGLLHLLVYYATPPVFDGPEDRNGLRNAAETGFWSAYLDGKLPWLPPDTGFVIAGDSNLDPVDGDGRGYAMRALLTDPRLQDPHPASAGGASAASAGQKGDPAEDTADWPETPDGPGNLRVDYVLPSAGLKVTGSGVIWPAAGDPASVALSIAATVASRHHLVWVEVDLP